MKLKELGPSAELRLPASSVLYRVQRIRSLPGAIRLGHLVLPPRGLMANRFDLATDDVGYFAEASDTAVYETLARREATMLSIGGTIALRELLTLETTRPLRLLDLRSHAHRWPLLQSLRYASNQALAASVQAAGYHGVVYRSAQQYGADCYAIFGSIPLRSLHLVSRAPLCHPATGALHRSVATAVRGGAVPLVP